MKIKDNILHSNKNDRAHMAYFDFGKIWVSFFFERIRIGINEGYITKGPNYLDFYFTDYNIDKEKLIYLKKIASDDEGMMLVKGILLNMLNLNEDEFIQESLRRLRG